MFKVESLKTRAFLAIGGNLGDREATIMGAVEAIDRIDGVKVKGVSKLVESFALTLEGTNQQQPNYLNGVVEVSTSLTPKALLIELNRVENDFGRVRLERWAPRTLDIDILSFGTELIETKSLVVPHPRAHERAFVLVPWADLDPDAILPGHGKVADLAGEMADQVWDFK